MKEVLIAGLILFALVLYMLIPILMLIGAILDDIWGLFLF